MDEEYYEGPEAEWYCNHDVPDGCRPCAAQRRFEQLEASVLAEGGRMFPPIEKSWAPFGPDWQAEERERRGL